MFIGSLPADLSKVIAEHLRAWQPAHVYVGCSGNFTIERTVQLALGEHVPLHGNDVSIYTAAIGSALAGQPFRLDVRPEMADDWGWLLEWCDTPERRIATMMLCTRLLDSLHRSELYFERNRAEYRRTWPDLHAKSVEKVKARWSSLADFYIGDVRTFIADADPKGAAFLSFPPFYRGGYENLYKGLEAVFDWDQPAYEDFGPEDALAFADTVADKFPHWLIGTNARLDQGDWPGRLRARIKPSVISAEFFVYSSSGPVRIVEPPARGQQVVTAKLTRGQVLGDRLALAPLTAGQYQNLAARYLSASIAPGTPGMACAVLVDGVLIGAFGYESTSKGSHIHPDLDQPEAYLLGDFTVDGHDYPKLSKLVVLAATSAEARALLEQRRMGRYRSLYTTAFAKRPVSMKYRGLLDLLARDERKPEEGGGFRLIYGGPLGQHTLAEALDTWRTRWGQRKEPAGV